MGDRCAGGREKRSSVFISAARYRYFAPRGWNEDSNDFRRRNLYFRDVDAVLRSNDGMLRRLWRASTDDDSDAHDGPSMSAESWITLLFAANLIRGADGPAEFGEVEVRYGRG